MADVDDDVLNLDDDEERAPASDRKVSKKDNAKNKKNSIEDALDDPVAGDQLISIVERIERLEEEKKTVSDDIKEVYSEAKANGYNTKILRKVIAIRKRDADERKEEEAILELYLEALGVD